MNQFTASLWGDEAWAASLAVKSYWEIIKIVSRDTSPPLYYLLLHTWMKFFGTNEVSIRSLSFLFFLGTVITVFFVGKLLWDQKTGLLAAVLTLFNPFLFNYAFEGRMYTLLALTSTLSVYFFLKKNRPGFILFTVAALYTHHFSLFIIVFLFLWRLIEIPKKSVGQIIRSFSDFFIVGLLYLPWLYPLYYQTSLVGSGFWLGKPDFEVFKETIRKFLVGSGTETLREIAYWLVAALLLLRNWGQKIKKTAFLFCWFFAALVLTFLISQKFQSIFYDRYMLISIPASCLLLSSNRRKISLPPLGILIVVMAILNFTYFTHPVKKPFRQLALYAAKELPQATFINYNGAAHHLWESKYYKIKAPIFSPTPLPFYTGTALMQPDDVIKTLPPVKNIYAITSENPKNVTLPAYKEGKIIDFSNLYLVEFNKIK